ncbi:MAG: DUF5110 domain-containing protein, partial [Ktedonobacterales bacterium]|nr:DUF5110 domain-containing protein [Ktedonobacterales bacterium]
AYTAIEDQVLLGGDVLAAPVCEEDQITRDIHIPPGTWREWLSGERFVGPRRATAATPLDVLPLYVREGAILPLGPVMQYVGERTPDPLTLAVYLGPEAGATASGTLYEDDGETPDYRQGAWRRARFRAERADGRLTLWAEQEHGGAYAVEPRDWLVEFHLPRQDPDEPRPTVELSGLRDKPELTTWEIVPRRYETLIRVPLGRVAPPWTLEVRCGSVGR